MYYTQKHTHICTHFAHVKHGNGKNCKDLPPETDNHLTKGKRFPRRAVRSNFKKNALNKKSEALQVLNVLAQEMTKEVA